MPWSTDTNVQPSTYKGRPRNIDAIDAITYADNLQPPQYDIFGTHEESKILFLDVNILDSSGEEPYRGDVLVESELA